MQLKIGALTYDLRAMTAEEITENDAWGIHNAHHQLIALDASRTPARQAQTLIHELIHAAYAMAETHTSPKLGEEDVCTLLDGPLTAIFADNPELLVRISMALNNGHPIVGPRMLISPVPLPLPLPVGGLVPIPGWAGPVISPRDGVY